MRAANPGNPQTGRRAFTSSSAYAFVAFPNPTWIGRGLRIPDDPSRIYVNLEPDRRASLFGLHALLVHNALFNPMFHGLDTPGAPSEDVPWWIANVIAAQVLLHEATHLAWTCMVAEDRADLRFASGRALGGTATIFNPLPVPGAQGSRTPSDGIVYSNDTWEHRLIGLTQIVYVVAYGVQTAFADLVQGGPLVAAALGGP